MPNRAKLELGLCALMISPGQEKPGSQTRSIHQSQTVRSGELGLKVEKETIGQQTSPSLSSPAFSLGSIPHILCLKISIDFPERIPPEIISKLKPLKEKSWKNTNVTLCVKQPGERASLHSHGQNKNFGFFLDEGLIKWFL